MAYFRIKRRSSKFQFYRQSASFLVNINSKRCALIRKRCQLQIKKFLHIFSFDSGFLALSSQYASLCILFRILSRGLILQKTRYCLIHFIPQPPFNVFGITSVLYVISHNMIVLCLFSRFRYYIRGYQCLLSCGLNSSSYIYISHKTKGCDIWPPLKSQLRRLFLTGEHCAISICAGLGADLKTLKKTLKIVKVPKNLKKRGFSSKNLKKGEQNLKKFLRTLKTSSKGVNWHFLKLYLERCTLDWQKNL